MKIKFLLLAPIYLLWGCAVAAPKQPLKIAFVTSAPLGVVVGRNCAWATIRQSLRPPPLAVTSLG